MSFFGSLLRGIGQLAGSWLGGQAQSRIPGLGSAQDMRNQGMMLGGNLAQMLGPSAGEQAGRFAKDYYDKAFANTSVYDRLGASNAAGQIQSAANQIESNEKMQARELKTRKEIAEINADATKTAAATPYGGTNTPASNAQTRISAEVQLLKQKAETERNVEKIRRAEAKIADFLALQKALAGDPTILRVGTKAYELFVQTFGRPPVSSDFGTVGPTPPFTRANPGAFGNGLPNAGRQTSSLPKAKKGESFTEAVQKYLRRKEYEKSLKEKNKSTHYKN